MAQSYNTLSGETIIRSIRSRNQRSRLLCILGIAAGCAVLVGGLKYLLQEQHYIYALLGLLLVAFLIYEAFEAISKANRTLADTENCRLFRKFGAADTIAARIAEESSAPLLDSKGALICDSFLMKHNDFESYIPFEQILLIYRREHRTNGILDSVSLVVHDAYGDQQQYPFKIGKKGTAEMQEIMQHIMEKAPQCTAGYSKEALAYAKQNAKKLD